MIYVIRRVQRHRARGTVRVDQEEHARTRCVRRQDVFDGKLNALDGKTYSQ